MNDIIIDCTKRCLQAVTHLRLFVSERAYHGSFQIAMSIELTSSGLLADRRRLLEVEYQKSLRRHRLKQRPDMIFHIPVEVSGDDERANNYAVWAFKLRSNEKDAREDFGKLDQMFRELNYPLGFFINIESESNLLDCYDGTFADRLYSTGVYLDHQGEPVFDLKRASG